MKKKEKVKPRKQNLGLNIKERIFNYYIKETEEDTKNYNKFLCEQNNLDKIDFHLFQTIQSKEKMRDKLFELAYFYDVNFVGNKDFIHIPNISNIVDNTIHYPIILATKKDTLGNEYIIGATTIKMENNNSISSNPYFPTKNENVLSITGILCNMDATFSNGNKITGIGRQLYKTSIKGACEINKNENIRLVCEIDCRNRNSLYSISNAVRELNNEGMKVQLEVVGYYEVFDKTNKSLAAPTFVLEVDLSGSKDINHEEKYFNFNGYKKYNNELNEGLSEIIKDNTKEYRRFINTKEDNIVVYHRIKAIDALKLTIKSDNTIAGNDRVPIMKSLNVKYV